MNPIIGRELLTRWRTLKSFALVLAYAVPLAVGVIGAYFSSVAWAADELSNVAIKPGFHAVSAMTGRSLFLTLAWMQVAGWIIFAPTLTATTIAGERERGLLESLQLSCLTRWQLVGAKLTSALLFVLLSMLAALPVVSICFLFGGVSATDFVAAALLSLATAVCCACLGIASAWAHRGAAAMRSTYITIGLWLFAMFVILFLTEGDELCTRWFNQVEAALWIADPHFGGFGTAGEFLPAWVGCIAFETIAAVYFLVIACRGLQRPLEQARWIERSVETPVNGGETKKQGRMELGGIAKLSFKNPILTREFRGKFRMRYVPDIVIAFELLLGVAVAFMYLDVFLNMFFDPSTRGATWWWMWNICLGLIMVAAPVMGAGAFTHERETGTWPGIKLSSLTADDIVFGKLLAILLTCLVFSFPAWLLLLPALIPTNSPNMVYDSPPTIPQAVLTVVVIALATWVFALCGMCVSRCCRRTAAAVGWTCAVIFGLFFLFPGAMASLAQSPGETGLWWSLNPFGALSNLSDSSLSGQHGFHGALHCVIIPLLFLLCLGLLLLSALYLFVRADLCTEDQT